MIELITPYHIDELWNNDGGYEMATINDANHFWVFDCYASDADELLKRLNAFDQLQSQNDELVARVARLEEAANCINHWHDSGADGMVVSSDHVRNLWQVLNETKSQSLQHIQDEVVENMLVKVKQIIDEASIGISSFDATETVGEISRGIESLRQQPRG